MCIRDRPHSEPVFTVAAAAAQRGVVAEEMVKSILLRESRSDRYTMACVLGPAPVSYTHLDVYKRQSVYFAPMFDTEHRYYVSFIVNLIENAVDADTKAEIRSSLKSLGARGTRVTL